jgi:hypothetical protein
MIVVGEQEVMKALTVMPKACIRPMTKWEERSNIMVTAARKARAARLVAKALHERRRGKT